MSHSPILALPPVLQEIDRTFFFLEELKIWLEILFLTTVDVDGLALKTQVYWKSSLDLELFCKPCYFVNIYYFTSNVNLFTSHLSYGELGPHFITAVSVRTAQITRNVFF